jgi:hypothetical protein
VVGHLRRLELVSGLMSVRVTLRDALRGGEWRQMVTVCSLVRLIMRPTALASTVHTSPSPNETALTVRPTLALRPNGSAVARGGGTIELATGQADRGERTLQAHYDLINCHENQSPCIVMCLAPSPTRLAMGCDAECPR